MNIASTLVFAWALAGQPAGDGAQSAASHADAIQLDEIVVTAQRRTTTVQDATLSISAFSGEALERQRIMSIDDLGQSTAGLSFTSTSPQANEVNIRGVVNTRLVSSSADQSVALFADDVVVSRSGNLSTAFYDIERIEIVRGPQGVLLGKNVAGGAVNILSREPSFSSGGALNFTLGNYDLSQVSGHITGPLNDNLAARLSFQVTDRGGYYRDILNNVDLEDLSSTQARLQFLYRPTDSDTTARLILDYDRNSGGGIHKVAVRDPSAAGPGPWSVVRDMIAAARGGLKFEESLPWRPHFQGEAGPSPHGVERDTFSGIFNYETRIAPSITFTSITGYRANDTFLQYDQTSVGPTNGYGFTAPLLFAVQVNFNESSEQFSQEFRLASDYDDRRFNWIVGAYYQRQTVDQFNRFGGETEYQPGGLAPFVLGSTGGETHWTDNAVNTSSAVFAQGRYDFTDALTLELGVRYTRDEKTGRGTADAIDTGDQFVPTDPTPLNLVEPHFAFTYGGEWSELTPQATLSYSPPEADWMIYATYSQGFKGGGFPNIPTSLAAAVTSYRPETVTNYEIGFKAEFFDRRVRWNTSVFHMSYQDMQVQQQVPACLCNVIGNAAAATINGLETEFEAAPTRWLRTWISASLLDATYDEYLDPAGVDRSGNELLRTPPWQVALGAEATLDVGSWSDALSLRVAYRHQAKIYWLPDNLNWEDDYGLLDARVGLQIPNTDWTLSAWGKNLTGTRYRLAVSPYFGDEVGHYGAPRTFGIDLSTRF